MEHLVKKDYLAFISYKRDDEDMAVRLQEAVESFKLPTELIIEDPKLERYQIRYLFRDKTDMAGGVLPDIIKQGLDSSHYLIVICSPRVLESKWVNKEIEYFLSLSDDNYKKVIPFVIEGEPYSKTNECLPQSIRDIPKSRELLAINLNDFIGEDRMQIAVVKILSVLLGLKFDALWNRHLRREKQEKAKRIAEKKNFQILESRYLSKAAEDCLENGDVCDAFVSALKALPIDLSDNNDRPYVAESERVLRRILSSKYRFLENYGKPDYCYQWTVSNDGKMVATKDGNNPSICLWNVQNKALIKELPSLTGQYSVFEFNSDSTKLLIASPKKCVVRLICMATGNVLNDINVDNPEYAVLSKDENYLLTVSRVVQQFGGNFINGYDVFIWDLCSGECIDSQTIEISRHFKELSPAPQLSRDNRFVSFCFRNEVEEEVFEGPLEGYSIYKTRSCDLYLWNRERERGYWLRDLPSRSVNSFFVSSNGNYQILLLNDGHLGIAQMTDSKFKLVDSGQKEIRSVVYSLDGEYIKLVSEDGTEAVCNLSERVKVQDSDLESIEFEEAMNKCSLSEDEVNPFFEMFLSGASQLIRYADTRLSDMRGNDPNDVKISSKGMVAATYSNPHEIILWKDYRYNEYVNLNTNNGYVDCIEFSHDSRILASVCARDSSVKLWSTDTCECIYSIPRFECPDHYDPESKSLEVRFSHDDKILLIWYKYYVCLWSIETESYLSHHYCGSKYEPWGTVLMNGHNFVEVCEFPLEIDAYKMAYAVSPDNLLLAVYTGRKLLIYNIKDGVLISSRDIKYEFDEISSLLRFSSDSRYVVLSNRNLVSVWDMSSESPVMVYDELERVKAAGLCSECELFYFASKERIMIREHKPLQKLIDYIRGVLIQDC